MFTITKLHNVALIPVGVHVMELQEMACKSVTFP